MLDREKLRAEFREYINEAKSYQSYDAGGKPEFTLFIDNKAYLVTDNIGKIEKKMKTTSFKKDSADKEIKITLFARGKTTTVDHTKYL